MHDLAFADAARPAPRCILRLQMRPYSIGHELILLSRRNPLVCLEHEAFNTLTIAQQINALINAVLVCYRTWEQNGKPERNMWLWSRFIKNTDWPLAIAEFRIYRAEGSLCPPLTDTQFSDAPPESADGRSYGSPFLARLISFLRSRPSSILHPPSSFSVEPVMDYQLGLAAFEYFAAMEEAGRVQVENASEQETRTSFQANAEAIRQDQAAAEAMKKQPAPETDTHTNAKGT